MAQYTYDFLVRLTPAQKEFLERCCTLAGSDKYLPNEGMTWALRPLPTEVLKALQAATRVRR